MAVHLAKTQISLGICPDWSEYLQSTWKLGSLATHWVHSKDSDQTGRMPWRICVFAGCTLILLVLSCRGSFSVLCDLGLHCLPRHHTRLDLNELCKKLVKNSDTWKNAVHTGSYMSDQLLLNLLNKFNKFNNTGARKQDSMHHITLKPHFISKFALKSQDLTIRKCDIFMDINA